MRVLIEVVAVLLLPIVFIATMILGAIIKAVKEVGLFRVIILLMIGRHHSDHHHANSTFWRDSNGETVGHARYHMAPRYHRAGYKNLGRTLLGLWAFCSIVLGEALNYRLTSVVVGVCALVVVGVWCVRTYRKAQKWYRNKSVVSPIARGLASVVGVDEAAMEKAIVLKKGWEGVKVGEIGSIRFPDTFLGSDGEVEIVNRFVERRFPRSVETEWHHRSPVHVIIKSSPDFPEQILFEDRLSDISACKKREYVGGYDKRGEPVILSHTGDAPMKGFCMNTGTGKTVRVLSTAAQLLGNDPGCELVGFDVKQVSLLALVGIPGVTIYSNPFEMGEMWNGWYKIKTEMDRRYQEKKATGKYEGGDVWVFLEEGNTFGILIKAYYLNEVRQKGDSATPKIWYEAIAPILFQGREVGIFVNALLQNFMEKYFGNMSLRPAFNTIGLAGFKASQYRTIIGTSPVPTCHKGQGRLLICEPDREVWVKGLYSSPDYLVKYAMQKRTIHV